MNQKEKEQLDKIANILLWLIPLFLAIAFVGFGASERDGAFVYLAIFSVYYTPIAFLTAIILKAIVYSK